MSLVQVRCLGLWGVSPYKDLVLDSCFVCRFGTSGRGARVEGK